MAAPSIDDLLAEAAELVQMYEYQAAVDKYGEAYNLDPNNTLILDSLAEVLLEIGEVDNAQTLLERSIELKPDEGISKYMNLGQITSGYYAVSAFRKGIELIRQELIAKARRQDGKLKGLKRQLCSAYISISEIYMTDLCDEEEAEQVCSECLEEALTVDNKNWETLQALASFRISQQNPEDALEQMKLSYEVWRNMEPDDIDRPSYDARVAASKLLVELESYDIGAEVLESLLEDNDEDPETWYLAAFCYSHNDVYSAPECLERAKELLIKQNVQDASIHKQVDDLMASVEAKLATMPPLPETFSEE